MEFSCLFFRLPWIEHSASVELGRLHLFPQAYWKVLDSHRQLRQTSSSKLMQLGLVVSSLTSQSNSDCCAAAQGYLPEDMTNGILAIWDTTPTKPFQRLSRQDHLSL